MSQKMFKSKLVNVIVLIFFVITVVLGYLYFKYTTTFDYKKHINTFKELQRNDPKNCFYMQQIAANYSFSGNFVEAIKYYNDSIEACPNDSITIFQLGICHYIKGNYQLGLEYMDMAIKKAEERKEKDLLLTFQKEKSEWISGKNDLQQYLSKLKNNKPSFWRYVLAGSIVFD